MSLTLIATPIGHKEDISLRSLKALQDCQVLIGEEPKACRQILVDFGISPRDKQLYFLNEHSLKEDLLELIEICRTEDVCLITDCGTPGFCDPGADLVNLCYQNNIKVFSFPGPSSLMSFLSLTGQRWDQFDFLGFPPREKNERSQFMKSLSEKKHACIFMDAPYRLKSTLEDLKTYQPQLTFYLGLNLTSSAEEFHIGLAEQLQKKVKADKAPFVIGTRP